MSRPTWPTSPEDRRRRAILAKRYPSPRGPFPTDERSFAQLDEHVTGGPIRRAGEPTPAERVRAAQGAPEREARLALDLAALDRLAPKR